MTGAERPRRAARSAASLPQRSEEYRTGLRWSMPAAASVVAARFRDRAAMELGSPTRFDGGARFCGRADCALRRVLAAVCL